MKNLSVGILGGGQLGRMLQEAGQRWNLSLWCLDSHHSHPAGLYADYFVPGDIRNFDDVMAFGRDKDILTIEIEHVNLDALISLEAAGKKIHPNPRALHLIKNKNRQKEWYRSNGYPVPAFVTFENKKEALAVFDQLPFATPCMFKSAEMGYDGKGVSTIYHKDHVLELPDVAGAFEVRVNIANEVAVMAARNEEGQVAVYPPVSMEFDPDNHLLTEVNYPAPLNPDMLEFLEKTTKKLITSLDICGLLAVEYFIDVDDVVWINEVAPRPHNSMHLTMDNAVTGQFEQHLRGICNLPLGSVIMKGPGKMINLIGSIGDSGTPHWQGWQEVLAIPDIHIHLYGKTAIKPARKMGHINVCGTNEEAIETNAMIVMDKFKHVNNE